MSTETTSFVDAVFLAHFGLNRFNVLDYFLLPLNPFRTKSKTSNEVLTMQNITIGLLLHNGTNTSRTLGMASGGGIGGPGQGSGGGTMMTPRQAEEEYALQLAQLTGHQYELVPEADPIHLYPPSGIPSTQSDATTAGGVGGAGAGAPGGGGVEQPPPPQLFTIRHVFRSSPTKASVYGIYYVIEGVIYKSPAVRTLMKANVTRTCQGLEEACDILSKCVSYEPCTGYTWDFAAQMSGSSGNGTTSSSNNNGGNGQKKRKTISNNDQMDIDMNHEQNQQHEQDNDTQEYAKILQQVIQTRKKRSRRILTNTNSNTTTTINRSTATMDPRVQFMMEEEEKSIKAKDRINGILLRLSHSSSSRPLYNNNMNK